MRSFLISPSILSANLAALGEDVHDVLAAGADMVHIDVMDHHYVPNLTFGPLICQALRHAGVDAPLDVHLMVSPVDPLIEGFATAGANRIAFHPDATTHLDRTVQWVKQCGCEVGLALNPATSLSVLDHILPELDFVLIMTVNPGFGGQQLIPYVFDKIKTLKERIDHLGLMTRIQVDGGVKAENIASLACAGVDTFVAGSAIFGQSDRKAAIEQLRRALVSEN